MKKQRRSKEEEYKTILRKLIKSQGLTRKDFEAPKVKGKSYVDKLDSKLRKEDFVPHSSLIDRLNELVKLEVIEEFYSGNISKKGLPIMEYEITWLGTIFLLQLCDESKYLPNILPNISNIPHIWLAVKSLTKVFSKKQIFETLVSVAKNIRIEIEKDPLNQKIREGWLPGLTAWELLKGKNGIKIYFLELRLNHGRSSHLIRERFSVFGEKRHGKIVFPNVRHEIKIIKLFSVSFFHELILRCTRDEIKYLKYPREIGRKLVLMRLSHYKEMKDEYVELLEKVETAREQESIMIKNIKKALK